MYLLRQWRRLDQPGLEVFRLSRNADGVEVRSTLTHGGKRPFGLRYVWTLDGSWRTRTLRLDLSADSDRLLLIERSGPASWRVDGEARPDLGGCDEIDVSATPFCNSLAIRHLRYRSGELTSLYVQVPELTMAPSRQRYEALPGNRWRYVDLGACAGFQAVLELDRDGLVTSYEGLFEALR